MSLLHSILGQCLRSASHVAIIDDQRKYTYAKLAGAAMHLAEQVDSATANPHVGILLPTSGAFPAALLGTWLAGRTAVPLNYLLSPEELRYVIKDSGIDTVLTAGVMLEFLGDNVLPDDLKIVKLEDVDFTGVLPLRWPPIKSDDDLAVLIYTSGTSGRPKGVMLSHGNLQFEIEAIVKHIGLTEADTFLGVLPQFHSFGLSALTLLPLRIGSTVVYSARFVPRRIVELISEHRPQVMMAVPSMYGALLGVKSATPDDFKSVRLPVSGGEPLPEAVYDGLLERFNLRLLEGYGLTETSPATNWSLPENAKRYSVGEALPGVRNLIVDEKDNPLPTGEEGEILIAGGLVMLGYYNLPEQTQQVFVELIDPLDGKRKQFFRTGDIGKVDEDGCLFITGRKKEMLIIGGENVFPREIEEALVRHPSVQAAAVVGMKDITRGEVPVAFVEAIEGGTIDANELRSSCRDQLAGYKVPREIRQMETLPRNPTGKILRRELVKLVASPEATQAKA